ncbi:hypothetical protein QFZ70_003560 [Arthrobacter sp. V1I9]|uniref:hypothetical protein n=1 Tax=Arthrobacter sp. V1I9 TaxID=3042275 RepID=UPI00279161C6|nr:hypothetical protein [Arthrobacter sp. V1I9]MDQ0871087.1 hypothetical protein [Arthrobacter sp. V1I9]
MWDFIADLLDQLFGSGDSVADSVTGDGGSIFDDAMVIGDGAGTGAGSILGDAAPVSEEASPGAVPPPADAPAPDHKAEPLFGMAMDGGVDENGNPLTWSTAERAGGALYDGNQEVEEA